MSTHLLSAPHAHAPDSVPRIMSLVLLAVAPATLYGIVLFGWPALNLFVITILTCLLCEAVCHFIAAYNRSVEEEGLPLEGWRGF